ncbi:MAG: hypothetical protein ACRDKH_02495 [Solirubrobacterales bacterium]
MGGDRAQARRIGALVALTAAAALVAAPATATAEPLTATKSKVVRGAQPEPHASAGEEEGEQAGPRSAVSAPSR